LDKTIAIIVTDLAQNMKQQILKRKLY